MPALLLVACGGALGAISRYSVALLLPMNIFPLATLLINLSGSLALGWLTRYFSEQPTWLLLGGTGFLGAFTTFSTFSVDVLNLLHEGHGKSALIYVLASLMGGVMCAWAGWKLGSIF